MAHYFSKSYVRSYWPTIAGRYARSFQAFANDLLARRFARGTLDAACARAARPLAPPSLETAR
jgi:hypothetical protein